MLVTNKMICLFFVFFSPGVVEISGCCFFFCEKVKFIWGMFQEIFADVTVNFFQLKQ